MTSREKGLDFLTTGAPGVTLVTRGRDLRRAFIEMLGSSTSAMR
jgi:hypothetical protein